MGDAKTQEPMAALTRASVLVEKAMLNPRVRRAVDTFQLLPVCRVVICLFFINQSVTDFEAFYYGNGYPFVSTIVLPCAVAAMFNLKLHIFGGVLLGAAVYDTLRITHHQVWQYLDGHGLYVNELMVKRLSITACSALLLAHDKIVQETRGGRELAGIILETNKPAEEKGSKKSAFLLVARLLLSTLFLFVGINELRNQLATEVRHGDHVHRKQFIQGDGHNNFWAKLFEFLLSVPFVVGFKTKIVSRALAAVLVMEAMFSWRFWTTALGLGYKLHARQHFCVNMAVAAGLLLLQVHGAGKFSVDNMLKKQQ